MQTVALMAVIILVMTLVAEGGMLAMLGISFRSWPVWRFPDLLLPVVAPVFAAGAFAKEHEQRTWQDLVMTSLTGREIVVGKFVASLIPTVMTIIVILPPLLMVLILSSVPWALTPGPWMLIFAVRFFVLALSYLAVGLVCSYHSSNARSSLVLGYVVLALYGFLSFGIWNFLFNGLRIGEPTYNTFSSTYTTNDLFSLSEHEFSMSLTDIVFLTQSVAVFIVLFGYLLYRVRDGRAMMGQAQTG